MASRRTWPLIKSPGAFRLENDVPIEKLFVDFFHYYGTEFEKGCVASIRLGHKAKISDEELHDLHLPFNNRHTLNLEDPFDYSVKGTSIYRRNLAVTLNKASEVLDIIQATWDNLDAQIRKKGTDVDITDTMTKKCIGCLKLFKYAAPGCDDKGIWYCVDCWEEWDNHNSRRISSGNNQGGRRGEMTRGKENDVRVKTRQTQQESWYAPKQKRENKPVNADGAHPWQPRTEKLKSQPRERGADFPSEDLRDWSEAWPALSDKKQVSKPNGWWKH